MMNDDLADAEDSAQLDAVLDRLIEQISQQCRLGHTLDVESLIAAYPQYENELSALVPTIIALEARRPSTSASSPSHSRTSPVIVAPSAANTAIPLETDQQIGEFRLLRELGRGGMGIVYEAEQSTLGRRVALKVFPMVGLLDDRQLQRFKNEARAAASLHHPNIVPVFSVGSDKGVHYFTMQLIEGQTVAKVIQQLARHGQSAENPAVSKAANLQQPEPADATASLPSMPPSVSTPQAQIDTSVSLRADTTTKTTSSSLSTAAHFRSVAEIGIQLAEALEYAHSLGIIHRDIKPSNLLIDTTGRAWIADFGLAHIEADAGMTLTGELLGTLRYMSPEQAHGRRRLVDARTDIYSLGVTLYEMLAGRPAFPSTDRQQLLRQLIEDEPIPPRQVNPSVPRDLETIILKATGKDPQTRYITAQEMADDLRRFLKFQPVLAKRPGLTEITSKWARRHAGAVAVAGACLLLGFLGLSLASLLIYLEQQQTQTALKAANAATISATEAQQRAQQQEHNMARLLARQQLERGLNQLAADEPTGMLDLMEAYSTADSIPELKESIGQLWSVAYGLWEDRLLQILPLQRRFKLSGDGLVLLGIVDTDTFRAYDTRSWQPIGPIMQHEDIVDEIALSADGTIAASLSKNGVAQMWDVATGQHLGPALRHEQREQRSPGYYFEHAIAFSPNGQVLATGGADQTARLWSVPTGEALHAPLRHEGPVIALAFTPDGKTLITSDRYGNLNRLWDVETGTLRAGALLRSSSTANPALNSDGSMAATLRPLSLWRLDTVKPIGKKSNSPGMTEVIFSPDDSRLAASCSDGKLRLYQVPNLEEVGEPRGHGARITSTAFAPDGGQLVSASFNGEVRFWEGTTGTSVGQRIDLGPRTDRCTVQFEPGGKWLVTCSYDDFLKVWHSSVGSERLTLPPWRADRCFAPDGGSVAMITGYFTASVVEFSNAQTLTTLHTPSQTVQGFAFTPDGSQLAVRRGGRQVDQYQLANGSLNFTYGSLMEVPRCVAYHPDGQQIAIGTQFGTVTLLPSNNAQSMRLPLPHGDSVKSQGDPVESVAYSPDGRLLATLAGSTVRIWALPLQDPPIALVVARGGHFANLRAVEFTTDGQWLIGRSDSAAHASWAWAIPESPTSKEEIALRTWMALGLKRKENGEVKTLDPEQWQQFTRAIAQTSHGQMRATRQERKARSLSAYTQHLVEQDNRYFGLQMQMANMALESKDAPVGPQLGTVLIDLVQQQLSHPAIDSRDLPLLLTQVQKFSALGPLRMQSTAADPFAPWIRDQHLALGNALLRLVEKLRNQKDSDAALMVVQVPLDLYKQLAQAFTDDVTVPTSLVEANRQWASCLIAVFGPHAAAHRLELALQQYRDRDLASLPDPNPSHRLELGVTAASLAAIQVDLGQFAKAIALYAEALEIDPDNFRYLNRLAWLLATCPDPHLRDAPRAEQLALRAIQFRGDGYCWKTLGVSRYHSGDYRGAVEALERSNRTYWELNPPLAFNYFFLAMANHQLNDAAAAQVWFERAIEWMEQHAPTNEELLRFRAEVEQHWASPATADRASQ